MVIRVRAIVQVNKKILNRGFDIVGSFSGKFCRAFTPSCKLHSLLVELIRASNRQSQQMEAQRQHETANVQIKFRPCVDKQNDYYG